MLKIYLLNEDRHPSTNKKKKKKSTSKLTYRQLVLSVIYREREEEAGRTLPISWFRKSLIRYDEAVGSTGSSHLHYWSKI